MIRLAAMLVLALVAAEVGLRIAGAWLLRPQVQGNAVRPADDGALRILTLGESTSADYFASDTDVSWPRQLEREIVRRGHRVRVYNESIPGTSTPYILANLERNLERYRPRIVVTMMGTNDAPHVRLDDGPGSGTELLLGRIRVLRVLEWLSDGGRPSPPLSEPVRPAIRDREGLYPAVEQIAGRILAGDDEEAHRALERLVADRPEARAEAWFAVSELLEAPRSGAGDPRLAVRFLLMASRELPWDSDILADLFRLARETDQTEHGTQKTHDLLADRVGLAGNAGRPSSTASGPTTRTISSTTSCGSGA